MNDINLTARLREVLSTYKNSFIAKSYDDENDDHDVLMDVFGVTPELKRENRQYWGRELGMCWQLIVTQIFQAKHNEFGPSLRVQNDEPCDFTFGKFAVDTKYRVGSGDSGTLKKFKSYGTLLRANGYEPVFLILRTDNLPSAITAVSTWQVYEGMDTFNFIKAHTDFDLFLFLSQTRGDYRVDR